MCAQESEDGQKSRDIFDEANDRVMAKTIMNYFDCDRISRFGCQYIVEDGNRDDGGGYSMVKKNIFDG